MKGFSLFLTGFLMVSITTSSAPHTAAFFWFDLGNVIVDTRNGFDRLDFMPGARDYLAAVKARGHKVGLITNIPDDWGQPGDRPSKIRKLVEVLNQGWIGQEPFSIEDFDEVLLPVSRAEQKPARPLFQKALEISGTEHRPAVFQGEDSREVEAARVYGLDSHLVEFDENACPVYMPIDKQ